MEYIKEIITYLAVAVAGFGGTSVCIGTFFAWVKKIIAKAIEKLTTSTVNYEEKVKRLEETAEKFDKASEFATDFSAKMAHFESVLNEAKTACDKTDDKYNSIVDALTIIVTNNPQFVANGTAKLVTDRLGTTDNTIHTDEV